MLSLFRLLPLVILCLNQASAFAEGDPGAKTGEVKKFPNATFNEEQFTATKVELRKLAYLQNARAAKEVHLKCAEAINADEKYPTDEERALAIKAYCPRLPMPDNFHLQAVDVSCEIGEFCGEEFEVSKRDLINFKSYFQRKIRFVAEAKKLGMHMDDVTVYAGNKANPPERLKQFWLVRCFEGYAN